MKNRSDLPPEVRAAIRRERKLLLAVLIPHILILAALVVWVNLASGCALGAAAGSGILRVSCVDNGNESLIKQLEYSIDGGSQHVLGEGDSLQNWLDVGNHHLSGSWYSWYGSTGQPGPNGYFDEQVYVWDAEYGETTWSL